MEYQEFDPEAMKAAVAQNRKLLGMPPQEELSKRLGHEVTDTHLLTHNSWNSMPEYSSTGSNETGVRSMIKGVAQDDFQLIQHGWRDWQKAGYIIKRLLTKGRSVERISDVMDFIKERGWVNRAPKAKTL